MAFQGSLRELPLPDIIQLVAVSGKTGVFTLKNGAETGKIFLRKGQIVHAAVSTLVGEHAVYELARWQQGEFLFTPGTESEVESIDKSNTNLLMEAARQIDEWKILSKKIGSTRMVPVFAAQEGQSSVSFSPTRVGGGLQGGRAPEHRRDRRRARAWRLRGLQGDLRACSPPECWRCARICGACRSIVCSGW